MTGTSSASVPVEVSPQALIAFPIISLIFSHIPDLVHVAGFDIVFDS